MVEIKRHMAKTSEKWKGPGDRHLHDKTRKKGGEAGGVAILVGSRGAKGKYQSWDFVFENTFYGAEVFIAIRKNH